MLPCGTPSPSWAATKTSFHSSRLEVRLELRQVEVRAGSARQLLARVVEEDEPEVEQAGRDGGAIDQHVRLVQVPAARPDHQRGELGLVQGVGLLIGLEGQPAAHGLGDRPLAGDHVLPGGGEGVLEVAHEDPGARVERVDHHLRLDRPGDLDPPVVQVRAARAPRANPGRRGPRACSAGSPAARRRRSAPGVTRARPAGVGVCGRRTDAAAPRSRAPRASGPRRRAPRRRATWTPAPRTAPAQYPKRMRIML